MIMYISILRDDELMNLYGGGAIEVLDAGGGIIFAKDDIPASFDPKTILTKKPA